jgi:hypothetical protein
MRDEDEIEAVLNAMPTEGPRSKWPGMTYEQGVDAALRWALEWDDQNPMED